MFAEVGEGFGRFGDAVLFDEPAGAGLVSLRRKGEEEGGCSRLGGEGEAGGKGEGREELDEDGDAPAVVFARRGGPKSHAVADPCGVSRGPRPE